MALIWPLRHHIHDGTDNPVLFSSPQCLRKSKFLPSNFVQWLFTVFEFYRPNSFSAKKIYFGRCSFTFFQGWYHITKFAFLRHLLICDTNPEIWSDLIWSEFRLYPCDRPLEAESDGFYGTIDLPPIIVWKTEMTWRTVYSKKSCLCSLLTYFFSRL